MSAVFLGAYALAQVAAFLSFLPLLQVLIPLRAAAIDPAHKELLLGGVVAWGALAAGLSNLAVGALSDRTASRFGRRRPWMAAGLVGMVGAYSLIGAARDATGLITGLLAFQVACNAFFAPLGAIMADRVPDAQKGRASALLSLGFPLGNLLGVAFAGDLFGGVQGRLWALAVLTPLMAAPFLMLLREPRVQPGSKTAAPVVDAARGATRLRDFALAMGARLLTLTAMTLVQTYMLFALQARSGGRGEAPWLPAGLVPDQALGRLIAVSTLAYVAAALTCGVLSDRVRRRRPFVIGGGLGLGLAITCLALAPQWSALMAAYGFYGLAMGSYTAADNALMVQVLPSARHAGRDLGLVNLSNTLPQMAAPLLGLALLHPGRTPYDALFLFGALACVVGAGLTALIKGVR